MDHSKHSSNSQHDEYGGNIVEEIINLIDMIQAQINIITNSKDILSKDEDLIIFSYLLGYFTSRYHIALDQNKISNLILEFSSRNNNNNNREELSNKLTNLSLIMNDNFIEEESINIKSDNNVISGKKLDESLNIKNNTNKKNDEKQKNKNIENSQLINEMDNSKNFRLVLNNSDSDLNISIPSVKNSKNLLNMKTEDINKDNNKNNDINNNQKNKINNEEINENNNSNININESLMLNNSRTRSFLGKKKSLLIKMKKCEICLENFNEYDILNYELKCGCVIHYECFDNYIKNSVENNEIPILCPNCKKEVHPNLVYDSLVTNGHKDLVKKYEKFSMNNYILNHKDNYSCCPTPGCEYMFFYEKGENRLFCPMCHKDYCLSCKETWHKGMTCEEFRDSKNIKKLDEKFLNFANRARYKICPNCGAWVEKVEGCNNMLCKCKINFCYKCGKIIPKKIHDCPCWSK